MHFSSPDLWSYELLNCYHPASVVRNFFQTSSLKPLHGFKPNFTQLFLRVSFIKIMFDIRKKTWLKIEHRGKIADFEQITQKRLGCCKIERGKIDQHDDTNLCRKFQKDLLTDSCS